MILLRSMIMIQLRICDPSESWWSIDCSGQRLSFTYKFGGIRHRFCTRWTGDGTQCEYCGLVNEMPGFQRFAVDMVFSLSCRPPITPTNRIVNSVMGRIDANESIWNVARSDGIDDKGRLKSLNRPQLQCLVEHYRQINR